MQNSMYSLEEAIFLVVLFKKQHTTGEKLSEFYKKIDFVSRQNMYFK